MIYKAGSEAENVTRFFFFFLGGGGGGLETLTDTLLFAKYVILQSINGQKVESAREC